MRKLSKQRRQLVAQSGAMAAMSGTGPVLMHGHSHALWLWTAVMVAMAMWLLVRMVQVQRSEGCGR